LDVDGPLALAAADGSPMPGGVTFHDGKWTAAARVDLPAYGYRLLGLQERAAEAPVSWKTGNEIAFDGKHVGLSAGRLTLSEGRRQIAIAVAPFRLQDPSGAAQVEEVKPGFDRASTRVRETVFGPELEVFTSSPGPCGCGS
jgi:hypothetical protein